MSGDVQVYVRQQGSTGIFLRVYVLASKKVHSKYTSNHAYVCTRITYAFMGMDGWMGLHASIHVYVCTHCVCTQTVQLT